MKIKTTVILTLDEAKNEAAQFWANGLLGWDTESLADAILGGRLPNLKTATVKEILDLYAEMDMGTKLAEKYNADVVVVETGTPASVGFENDKLEVVWEKPIVLTTNGQTLSHETSTVATEVH